MTGTTTPRIALVTSERGLRIDPDLVLAEAALRVAGVAADVVRWDDPAVAWDSYGLSVVRSCWDYAWRLDEFLAWAGRVPRLRNPARMLRWNSDKRYVQDLERAGLPVVPTVWDPAVAGELPTAGEWVVKPSVSAGSRDTARWDRAEEVLAHVGELVAAGRTAMVQPYQASVDRSGEAAMLFLGGQFLHAVRKGPLLQRARVSARTGTAGGTSVRSSRPAHSGTWRRRSSTQCPTSCPGQNRRCTRGSTWWRTRRVALRSSNWN